MFDNEDYSFNNEPENDMDNVDESVDGDMPEEQGENSDNGPSMSFGEAIFTIFVGTGLLALFGALKSSESSTDYSNNFDVHDDETLFDDLNVYSDDNFNETTGMYNCETDIRSSFFRLTIFLKEHWKPVLVGLVVCVILGLGGYKIYEHMHLTTIDISSTDIVGESYKTVDNQLSKKGFTNIWLIPDDIE